ncbi:MAG: DUF1015 family protein, partial [Candidatus Omnitrophica bacterium]|nr:DUF1015 family protein [Candidatus Omnitrophota bacterium]
MPDVRAFKGVLYNSEKIKDIAKVVTEPYDVISSSEQAQYYRAHPCNIVRLILGKNYSGDTNKKNSYTRAAKFFN